MDVCFFIEEPTMTNDEPCVSVVLQALDTRWLSNGLG